MLREWHDYKRSTINSITINSSNSSNSSNSGSSRAGTAYPLPCIVRIDRPLLTGKRKAAAAAGAVAAAAVFSYNSSTSTHVPGPVKPVLADDITTEWEIVLTQQKQRSR